MTLDRLVRLYHIIVALEDLRVGQTISKSHMAAILEEKGVLASERTFERDIADLQDNLNVTIEYVREGTRPGYRINTQDEDPTEFNGFCGFLRRLLKGNVAILHQTVDFLDSLKSDTPDLRRARSLSAMLRVYLEDSVSEDESMATSLLDGREWNQLPERKEVVS